MAKAAGRKAELRKNNVLIGGVRVLTIKVDTTPIDVTDRDSAGLVEFLTGAGDWATRQITLDVEGVYKDPVLRDIAFEPTATQVLTDLTFKFVDALAAKDTIGGTFQMLSYEEGNPHDDAGTFKASFASSGTWTYN